MEIASGPSKALAGPPHEILLLFAIHAPPFWGARKSNGVVATYLQIPKGYELDEWRPVLGLVTSVEPLRAL